MRRCLRLLTIGTAAAVCLGCQRGEREREPPAPPAVAPSGLVKLSAAAQKNIGLGVQQATRRPLRQTIAANGWLLVKPGREVLVKAPQTGFILPPHGQAGLPLGAVVSREQEPVGWLHAVLSPVEQADLVSAKKEADILIRQSLATLRRADLQLGRLKGIEDVVAGVRIDELKETAERARVAYQEALEKLPFLPEEPCQRPLQLQPLPLEAPLAGRIVKVYVSPRQLVVQGDPLWTIADWSWLWIRVPVFEGDLPRLEGGEKAEVEVPGTKEAYVGTPVELPQPTEPGRRTVDLYYEIRNRAATLRPGQAVAVSLPAGAMREQLVIPRAAVLWDAMGNAAVYVQTEPEGFSRRRVELGQTIGNHVVVLRGLQDSEVVVTVGAEALYAEQFKGEIQRLEEKE